MRSATVDDYRSILLDARPMIDLRAAVEYAKGSFPTAVNLPLMVDSEREAVGIEYKLRGPDAARELGHRLVSGKVREERMARWKAFAARHPDALLFCFRGGMRSRIVQEWLAEEGVRLPRVDGGYKALRNWVLAEIGRLCRPDSVLSPLILGGRTGCGKTDLLREFPGSVDLEGLAGHRGSAFGRRIGGQPTQIAFENRLAVELSTLAEELERTPGGNPRRPLLLEDESRRIGRITLPLELHQRMQRSRLVVLETSMPERVEITREQYVEHNLEEIMARCADSEDPLERALQELETDLLTSIQRIGRRLGGARAERVSGMVRIAMQRHRNGDSTAHSDWIRVLLDEYYDPMYDYQIGRKAHVVAFKGNRAQVADWLSDQMR